MASEADSLAKALYPHLIECGFGHRTLEDAGWFTFVVSKRPDTESPVTMACHALTFLCLTGKLGNMRMSCVHAVISFLKLKTDQFPAAPELRKLKELLDAKPINVEHVHQWFHRNYA